MSTYNIHFYDKISNRKYIIKLFFLLIFYKTVCYDYPLEASRLPKAMKAIAFLSYITKTRLFKYIENFVSKKKGKFSEKKNLIFFKFLLKT